VGGGLRAGLVCLNKRDELAQSMVELASSRCNMPRFLWRLCLLHCKMM